MPSTTGMKRSVLCSVAALLSVVACRSEQNTPPPVAEAPAASSATKTVIKNVLLQLTETVAVHIQELRGELSAREGQTLSFDDPRSYVVSIASSEVSLTPDNLAKFLNDHAFAYKDAPVRKIEIEMKEGELRMKGLLNKVVDVPFEIRGRPEVTSKGEIALTATSIRGAGVPVKGLLGVFGGDLDALVDEKKVRGLRIVENTIFVSIAIVPPPSINGRFSAVAVHPDRIAISLRGDAPAVDIATPETGNYLVLQGGTSQLLKMTMHHTDLQLVDEKPADPFRFNLHNYRPQLVAGSVGVTTHDGLVIRLPDQGDAIHSQSPYQSRSASTAERGPRQPGSRPAK